VTLDALDAALAVPVPAYEPLIGAFRDLVVPSNVTATPDLAAEEAQRARRPPIGPLKKFSGQNGTRFGREKSLAGGTSLVSAAKKV
jgi:hypothetical protein